MRYVMYGMSALLIGAPVLMAKDVVGESTHSGKFVSYTNEKLVMTDANGKEHSHALATNVPIACDGKKCKATDLVAGQRIRVTTKDDASDVPVRIEALNEQTDFVNTQEGKFVSLTNHQLVMTNKGGKERTNMVGADAKVTCDGKACKCEELKDGMRIRVTIAADGKRLVTQVEALGKNENFEKLN